MDSSSQFLRTNDLVRISVLISSNVASEPLKVTGLRKLIVFDVYNLCVDIAMPPNKN